MKTKLFPKDYFIFDYVLIKAVTAHIPSEKKKLTIAFKKIYGCEF